MFKLGFFEAVVILTVSVIVFGPWLISKVKRTLTEISDEYKEGLKGPSRSDKPTKN